MKMEADFSKCVKVAREMFESYFNNNIQDLVYSYPKDAVDKFGYPFWYGAKRFPTAIAFDPEDPLAV